MWYDLSMMASKIDNSAVEVSSAADLKRELEETMKRVAAEDIPRDSEFAEISDLIKIEEERAKDPKSKPDIDNLSDAVVFLEDGTPVFVPEVGEKVIIERYTSLLPGRPWLDTRVYVVREIDEDTGRLSLWDEDSKYWATSNFIDGLKNGYRFKLTPDVGRGISKKRHRRTKEERMLAKQDALEKSFEKKKKRGRKPGTKNRSKEVIAVEKAERAKTRGENAAKRDLRKRIKQAAVAVPLRTIAGGTEKKPRKKTSRRTKARRVRNVK